MKSLLTIFVLLICLHLPESSFKDDQLRYPRVREAYREKEHRMVSILQDYAISKESLRLFISAFKHEKTIELWAKDTTDSAFSLIREYDICRISGGPGPKRRQGDMQIPEGFYYINRFNPASRFHLSLGLNYPNTSDRILGGNNPGGDIFIHGSCVTIGCLPVTDDKIKELYIFCVEARNSGQENIPVYIFPATPGGAKFSALKEQYHGDPDKMDLWKDLKSARDIFYKTKELPKITFLNNGRHSIQPSD